MTGRDWEGSEYTRIYHTVIDDPKFADVFDDDRRWAAYTRLLMAAEAAYPAPAPLPRWLDDDVLEHLAEVRIIELVRGSAYRIVAMQAEREARLGGHAVGGRARAEQAARDASGKFVPDDPDAASKSSSDESSDEPAESSKPSKSASKNGAGPSSKTQRSSVAEPSLAKPSKDEKRISSRTREDIDALRARGWPRVTKGQRAILDEVAGRHDETGYRFAAAAIEATPPDADPLAAVMAADRLWQESRARQAEADEAKWSAAKADDKATAGEALESLGGFGR